MTTFWDLSGRIKPNSEKVAAVKHVLRQYRCTYKSSKKSGDLSIEFHDDNRYDFMDELANALDEYVEFGYISAHEADDPEYLRCQFENNTHKYVTGKNYVYYPGFEDEFFNALPEELKDYIMGIAKRKS